MISIIIPVNNGKENLQRCLKHILASRYKDYEIIVVDDCSDDGSADTAKSYTGNIIRLNRKSGPATARNIGSQKAKGNILLFLDADIVVMDNTIDCMVNFLNENKSVDGITGIYSESSRFNNFCSYYKRLYVIYKFIKMPEFVSMPNTAILAVRKDSFEKVNGFNEKMITGEDFEFGQRFSKAGYKIYIDKTLEVIHNRYFSFRTMVYDDFIKAVNLSYLFLNCRNTIYRCSGERGILSISIHQQVGVIVTVLLSINLFVLFFKLSPIFILTELILLLLSLMANINFWHYQWRGKTALFKIQSFLITYFEHLLSAIAAGIAVVRIIFKKSEVNFNLSE